MIVSQAASISKLYAVFRKRLRIITLATVGCLNRNRLLCDFDRCPFCKEPDYILINKCFDIAVKEVRMMIRLYVVIAVGRINAR